MPTYSYACTACDHRFDIHQEFSDDALTVCPECEGRLRKLFGSVGVTFKGSGFYRTDHGAGSASSAKNGNANGASASNESSGSNGSKSDGSSSSGSTSNGGGAKSSSKSSTASSAQSA